MLKNYVCIIQCNPMLWGVGWMQCTSWVTDVVCAYKRSLVSTSGVTDVVCERLDATGEAGGVGLQTPFRVALRGEPAVVDGHVLVPRRLVAAFHHQVGHRPEQLLTATDIYKTMVQAMEHRSSV